MVDYQPTTREVYAATEAILKFDKGEWCECRRSPFDRHNVNPPCSTRRDVERNAVAALVAAHSIRDEVAA